MNKKQNHIDHCPLRKQSNKIDTCEHFENTTHTQKDILSRLAFNQTTKEDATFIVHAVNCHEELVDLIKQLKDIALTRQGLAPHSLVDIDALIAKAEGRE